MEHETSQRVLIGRDLCGNGPCFGVESYSDDTIDIIRTEDGQDDPAGGRVTDTKAAFAAFVQRAKDGAFDKFL